MSPYPALNRCSKIIFWMELKPCLHICQVKRKVSTCYLPAILLLLDAGTTATVSAPSREGGEAAASQVGLEGHVGAEVMPLWSEGADATLSVSK